MAVIAVVADHLYAWPTGGFVGVDVFFVISGFLITGLLLREHEKTGTISFSGFYRRRIKRILPASTLVLILTVAAAYFLYTASRFQQTLTDGIWAFLFAGNWRFAAAGTDYFAASGPVSPLQHFWSLAVEEQFYFVWPWLMLAIFAIAARATRLSRTHAHRAVGIAMIVLSVASLAWAIWETINNPSVAYFSTFSRAWELGVGALIAVYASKLAQIPQTLRPILGWIGLTGIAISFFVVSEGASFPAPWALLPVTMTALVIVAGTGGEQRFLWPIMNPVTTWLGNISYSLYLWHFPVVILLAVLVPPTDLAYFLIAMPLMLVLATASFLGFEEPVRRSSWLSGLPKEERRRLKGKRRTQDAPTSTRFVLLALSFIVAASLVGAAFTQDHHPESGPVPSIADLTTSEPTATAVPESPLAADIRTALSAQTWPDLTPTMDEALGGPQAPKDIALCAGEDRPSSDECTWGSEGAMKTAVIVGDSTAVAYMRAFQLIAESGTDWRVENLASFGCPFVDINSWTSVLEDGVCTRMKQATVDRIQEIQPDLVIVTNTYEPRNSRDTGTAISIPDWTAGVSRILEMVNDDAAAIAVLAPPPSDRNVQDCYTRVSSPADCVSAVTARWTDTARAESAMAQRLGGSFIDSSSWFCVDRECPAFVGGVPVKLDQVHITAAYAEKIVPQIQAAFQKVGAF